MVALLADISFTMRLRLGAVFNLGESVMNATHHFRMKCARRYAIVNRLSTRRQRLLGQMRTLSLLPARIVILTKEREKLPKNVAKKYLHSIKSTRRVESLSFSLRVALSMETETGTATENNYQSIYSGQAKFCRK